LKPDKSKDIDPLLFKYNEYYEKGEVMRVLARPETSREAAATGNFGPETNMAGNTLKALEREKNIILTEMFGDEKYISSTPIGDMVDDMFAATGSMKFMKAQLLGEKTIPNTRQTMIIDGGGRIPAEFLSAPEVPEANKGKMANLKAKLSG